MRITRLLTAGAALAAVSVSAFAQDSKSEYSYTNIKGSSKDTQVVNLLNDSTSTRTTFERDAARRMVQNTHIFYPGGGKVKMDNDSIIDLISSFYENQFRHSQDPLAPYFMFMSRDAKMAMGMGGLVKMRGWYDFNGSIDDSDFSPFEIPVPRQPDQLRGLGWSPSGTALFFTILGRETAVGNWMAYIEANFGGYNGMDFKLKKAYLTINDFTVGYTKSTFSDPAAEPLVIDGGGANGKMSKSSMLVRYMRSLNKRFTVGGSIEFPSSKLGTDEYTKKLKDFTPDVVALCQYQWDNSLSHVRLAGLFRTLSYRDLKLGKNRAALGWGVQLSCVAKTSSPLTLYGIAAVGQGHSSYAGDLSKGSYDLLPTPGKQGDMYAPTSISLIAGAKYNFLENLYASVALSELRTFTKAGSPGDTYKYGLYGAVNLFYNITPRFLVGAEYLIGKRMNVDGSHGNANRIDAVFQVSF